MKTLEIIIVLLAVGGALAYAVWKIVRALKGQDKGSCSGCSSNCENCSVARINETLRRQ